MDSEGVRDRERKMEMVSTVFNIGRAHTIHSLSETYHPNHFGVSQNGPGQSSTMFRRDTFGETHQNVLVAVALGQGLGEGRLGHMCFALPIYQRGKL